MLQDSKLHCKNLSEITRIRKSYAIQLLLSLILTISETGCCYKKVFWKVLGVTKKRKILSQEMYGHTIYLKKKKKKKKK